MNINPLIDYFNQYLALSVEERSFIHEVFKERKVRRRQFTLQEGDICKHNTFVLEGCLKMYLVDANGKEYNLQFAIENDWIVDIGSFHSEKPSKLYIEALEHSVVLQIKKEDQWKMYEDFPKFNRIFRVLAEDALVSLQNRLLQNISSTAEERYLTFLEKKPELFNRISNVQIASYLGVTPEFLSTIRKKIANS